MCIKCLIIGDNSNACFLGKNAAASKQETQISGSVQEKPSCPSN